MVADGKVANGILINIILRKTILVQGAYFARQDYEIRMDCLQSWCVRKRYRKYMDVLNLLAKFVADDGKILHKNRPKYNRPKGFMFDPMRSSRVCLREAL